MAADRKSPAYKLSLGGLLTAIIILAVTAAAYSPTANIAIFSITSFCISVAILETGLRRGIFVYLVSGILALAWPGIALAWPFIFFFGPYPVVRHLADLKIKKQTLALPARLIFANIIALAAGLVFAREQFAGLAGRVGNMIWLLPVVLQVVLLMYDLGLGLLIRFYEMNLRQMR